MVMTRMTIRMMPQMIHQDVSKAAKAQRNHVH